jgi:hypothetical protein
MVTMEHKPNPLLTKARLTILNLNNFKIIEAMGLKSYFIEVPLNGITSVPNFMKIYQAFQKLQTDRLVI